LNSYQSNDEAGRLEVLYLSNTERVMLTPTTTKHPMTLYHNRRWMYIENNTRRRSRRFKHQRNTSSSFDRLAIKRPEGIYRASFHKRASQEYSPPQQEIPICWRTARMLFHINPQRHHNARDHEIMLFTASRLTKRL